MLNGFKLHSQCLILFQEMGDKDSGHDWYCFDCQESGEVILCEFCPRVFHRKCAKAHYISHSEKWKCPSCKVRKCFSCWVMYGTLYNTMGMQQQGHKKCTTYLFNAKNGDENVKLV